MADIVAQRSPEWRQDRAGKITASRFDDATKKDQAGRKYLAARRTYMLELAFERLSGIPKHAISGKALAWGTETESLAAQAYELDTGNVIQLAEFVTHPVHTFIGASPDFLVNLDGGGEMKCPHDEAVHVRTWLEGMPEEHMPQVQGGMLVTGRCWWDFVSFDPRQRPELQLYVQRIPRDEAYINNLLNELMQFEYELRDMVEVLLKRGATAALREAA